MKTTTLILIALFLTGCYRTQGYSWDPTTNDYVRDVNNDGLVDNVRRPDRTAVATPLEIRSAGNLCREERNRDVSKCVSRVAVCELFNRRDCDKVYEGCISDIFECESELNTVEVDPKYRTGVTRNRRR